MSDTTKPLPPLAEALRLNAAVSGEGVRKRGPRDANLYWVGCKDAFEHAVQIVAPYDAEIARLREERAKLRSRVAELLRDNRYSRAHSRRLRETIGEIVGVLEGSTVEVHSEVAKMVAKAVRS